MAKRCHPLTATAARWFTGLAEQAPKRLLALFGPDRMVWGSDWPVVNLGVGLPGWIDMTRVLLADLSDAERQAIGQGTARRVYRLGRG